MSMPPVPRGSGGFPITMVVFTVQDIAMSSRYYTELFGWEIQQLNADLAGIVTPAGPNGALRANLPSGFPGMVPYIAVHDVDDALKQVVDGGGSVEKAKWAIPGVGNMGRFKDQSGTIYGVTDSASDRRAHVPFPFGTNPKPLANTICSIEMYANDRAATASLLTNVFGWASAETMPNYTSFDAGASIGGVLQSHTPGSPAVAYIYVEDVQAKIAEIESRGGKRMGDPMHMPGMATFGYFADPSGAMVGLIGP